CRAADTPFPRCASCAVRYWGLCFNRKQTAVTIASSRETAAQDAPDAFRHCLRERIRLARELAALRAGFATVAEHYERVIRTMLALLADTADRHSFKVPVAATESLQVETSGAGPPVVLIPGLFGSEFGFRKLVPLLNSAGYRTIVVEPLGIGSSGRPQRADYSLTAQAERIAGVLDSLAIRQAFVIAHSLGGAEAFRLAYRRPDLVRGLI